MGEKFKKLKIRALKIRLLKSILTALASGALLFGILLFLSKLKLITYRPGFFTVLGIVLGLISSITVFLLLHTSVKKLARKLDETYGLSERVQTMLQFKNVDSAMLTLQRSDTDEALSAVARKSLGIKTVWIYILCFFLSASLTAAALIYSPAEEPPVEVPPIPDEAFAISDIQIAAMEELIQYVKDSEMDSPYKDSVATSLSELLEELKSTYTVREKNEAVAATSEYILQQTDMSSYALELIVEIWNTDTDSSKRLAESLNYYNWPKADEWDKFSSQATNFRATFIHPDSLTETPDQNKMVTETQMLFIKISSDLQSALKRSEMPPEDPLYSVISRLASANETNEDKTRVYGLSTLSEFIVSNGYSDTQRELDATMTALINDIFQALEQHKLNTDTGEYAISRICRIFDCECPDFERPVLRETSSGEPTSPGDDEGNGNSGGPGIGTVYGSDDLVLDPYTNTYVEYGTILDKYYALMFGKLQDGDYTDAEKEALEKYFSILYGGFEENKEN